jgi:hypothetical protein
LAISKEKAAQKPTKLLNPPIPGIIQLPQENRRVLIRELVVPEESEACIFMSRTD